MNYISIISLKYIYFFTVFAVATIDQNYVTNYFLCIDFFVIKKKLIICDTDISECD